MLTLNSYAKLNLYLEVLSKRKDNYHNIRTIFERIDLCDRITLLSRQDKEIRIKSYPPVVPEDASNLAYRSAKLLQDVFKIDKGVDIKIIKRIPVGAGLGGGSSNAASVLMGLNKLWGLGLNRSKLIDLAKRLGSDVSFFICNSSFAEGLGRPDEIRPLRALNKLRLWHILVVPPKEVSTALIYERWDTYLDKKGIRLTMPEYNAKIWTLALKKKDVSLIGNLLFNHLEIITLRLFPQVRHIKEELKHLGLKSILMSGSGPAVFGITSCRKEARRLSRQLRQEHKLWQVFVTKTT